MACGDSCFNSSISTPPPVAAWIHPDWRVSWRHHFTRLGPRFTGADFSRRNAARLSAMNAQRGSARAFARTVRDAIDWRGQTQTLFQCAEDPNPLPPIVVFWSDRDSVIPFSHAEALAKIVDGVRITRFERRGRDPHHQQQGSFVRALRHFLDTPCVATSAWANANSGPTRASIPA
jgi:pimeloyl-ACP methyl ester carboxylesterase